jgi:fumarate hydratase class II
MSTTTVDEIKAEAVRKETDSRGVVEVQADKLWGAQTQRPLEHFSVGKDLIPREMIISCAILKKAAAIQERAPSTASTNALTTADADMFSAMGTEPRYVFVDLFQIGLC